ncbi:MAG TPA: M20/M25/M40 family metallo-hydrolase [Phnomibacter sp.]|nr:M20/M25/M40 family metallo-hydrolase [Phnomibacter sp.]
MKKFLLSLAALPLFMAAIAGPGKKPAAEKAEPAVIEKIKDEGINRSQVMNIAWHLTEANGPRVTASPGFMKAANWAKEELTKYGLQNARVEPWGEFGKGWMQEKCYLAVTEPYYFPIIAIPKVWTSSTPGKGALTGNVIVINAADTVEFASKYKGKLSGKIVMMLSKDTLRPSFNADGKRFTAEELEKMANAQPPAPGGNRQGGAQGRPMNFGGAFAQTRRIAEMVNEENPGLILSIVSRGNDGTIFVQGGGAYAKDSKQAPASVVISSDEYLRIQRLVLAGVPVKMEAEVRTKFYTNDTQGYNVIAEIPGTDLKDEVVMLGAHLDSWQGSTGATDNAAGCASMMEAVRIIKTLGIQPRRTIRIALWSGEEQGLHGSRNWVKNNLADPVTMQLKPEHGKISAYFNLDNGTGKIRGIYCQQNAAVKPLFADWLTPFADLGANTVTISNTGGTDHQAFDGVGVPGFQFIQDPIEYDTRTHHTNMDSYDHLVPEDLKQASTIIAAFAMNAAQRDEKLPRKELPAPRPAPAAPGAVPAAAPARQ